VKKVFLISVAIMLAISTAVVGCAPPDGDEGIVLTVSQFFPPPPAALSAILFQAFTDEVTARTDGLVTFDVSWGGALASPPEHIDLVKNGVVDMAHIHLWFTPDRVPIADFELVFPFGPTDPLLLQEAKRQMYDEFPEFHEELADNNAVIIMVHAITPYEILSKQPVGNLTDLDGLNVGIIGEFFGRWFEPTGAVPVVAPSTERYTMLQTGVIDADILNIDLSRTFKTYEVTQYITDNKLTSHCAVEIIMNKDTWDSLSTDIQDIILEAAEDVSTEYATVTLPAYIAETLELFADEGITTVQLPEDDIVLWASLIDDIPAEWAASVEAKGYPGFEIIERWQEITTELGFNWSRHWGA
jgi:TRAP-type transport system periplasmic protein